MRFEAQQHRYYCGVDLHTRTMYVCILNQAGKVLIHRNLKCDRNESLEVIAPYRDDFGECLLCWYWLADLCTQEGLAFALGHALYMKAIYGGKSKNDRIDSFKIAALLHGGSLPQTYVYPYQMRATRDLLRRRLLFSHKLAELLSHIQNASTQYNLTRFEGRFDKAANREGLIRLAAPCRWSYIRAKGSAPPLVA